MNFLQKIEKYGDEHHPKWLDFLRVLLGVILLIRGIQYMGDTEALQEIIDRSQFEFMGFMLVHYVALAHVGGGALIILGLGTRVAILFQLPILLGAVFFINAKQGLYVANNTELLFSIVVLALLVFFLIYGSGPMSADGYLKRRRQVKE